VIELFLKQQNKKLIKTESMKLTRNKSLVFLSSSSHDAFLDTGTEPMVIFASGLCCEGKVMVAGDTTLNSTCIPSSSLSGDTKRYNLKESGTTQEHIHHYTCISILCFIAPFLCITLHQSCYNLL